MRITGIQRFTLLLVLACALVLTTAILRTEARQGTNLPAPQSASQVSIDPTDIGGVVTSSKGPEAGVWVIAETTDTPTKFRKIVVTDDLGRYLIPDLPKGNYKVWVRGYGLVDSQPVLSSPGKTLALTAVIAPDAKAAAQYYPADYWYSLMQIPPKSAFPMTISVPSGREPAHSSPGEVRPHISMTVSEAEWIYKLKRGCGSCHEFGNKFTREIPAELGTFSSSAEAWKRRIRSGQE